MDWFTILLIFLFFVLPLIQEVLARGRKGGQQLPPAEPGEEGGEGWSVDEFQRRREIERATAGSSEAEDDGKWSEGWGSWPVPIEQTEPEVVPDVEPARNPPAKLRLPETKPATMPVPTYDDDATSVVVWRPSAPVEVAAVAKPALGPRAPARRMVRTLTPGGIAAGLADRRALRRAIVLKEIIDEPLALRGSEPHGV